MNFSYLNSNIYSSKCDLVVEQIREAIMSGNINPGEKLPQDKLAAEFNISQTPIREALRVLETEGVLEHSSNKGVRVSEVSLEELVEISQIRRVLEPLAIRCAIKRLDNEVVSELEVIHAKMVESVRTGNLRECKLLDYRFHMSIYKQSGMPHLIRFINILWTKVPNDVYAVFPESLNTTLEEHRQLLDAIEQREIEKSKLCMERHMDRVLVEIIKYVREKGIEQTSSLEN